jgi:hypothetical protein
MEVKPDILTSFPSASRESSIEAGEKAFDPREVGSDACENAFELREGFSADGERENVGRHLGCALGRGVTTCGMPRARTASPAGSGG